MLFLFLSLIISYILILIIQKNIAASLREAAYKLNEQKSYFFIIKEDLVSNIIILFLSVFLLSYIIIDIILLWYSGNIVIVKKVKYIHNLGYTRRTIYGYKGKVWVCNRSSPDGEYPGEVIKRIKEAYRGNDFKNDYINAVKYVTS